MWIDKYNSEGYYDPTTYQAIRMVLRDELKRRYGTGYRPLYQLNRDHPTNCVNLLKGAK